jgi:hypothetical protein
MTHDRWLDLPAPVPGTRRQVRVLRFGAEGARPKAYLQAGLHGDELPGILALARLIEFLEDAQRSGRVLGEAVVVPVANPIGLAQVLMDRHTGRYDLALMTNFNRGWPDLAEAVAGDVAGRLGDDAAANVAAIRAALVGRAAALPEAGENRALRKLLFGLACDADLVLDLHCDLEAVPHLYVGTPLWPDAADLAAELGARAVLLAEVSGGEPFDEACSGPWWALARRFPERPIPAACLAATVELRGLTDVSEAVADRDAEALWRFLQRRGVVAGDPGPLPELPVEATPLAGVAMVRAPSGGIVSYEAAPGEVVRAGQRIAVIVDPLAAERRARRHAVAAPIDGVLYARSQNRLARAGELVAKIAGREPLPERAGKLLSD